MTKILLPLLIVVFLSDSRPESQGDFFTHWLGELAGTWGIGDGPIRLRAHVFLLAPH